MEPVHALEFVRANSSHGGADVVLEAAGAEETFRLAWECARPNAVVTIVAVSYTHLDVYKRQGQYPGITAQGYHFG